MEQAEYDRSLERFQAFLNTEPVIPILSRNLAFLLDENRAVETVEVDASLHCRTEGRKVVVSAAPYLMCDGYDRRHWLAAMRVLLAHEVQHDNSSDRRVLAALRSFAGNRLHETAGIPFDAGGAIGQRLLNALEDARVDNIVCQRFPGYVPLLRFTAYARRAGLPVIERKAADGGEELLHFLGNITSTALTGLPLEGAAHYAGTRFAAETERLRPMIEASVLAETAADCEALCRKMVLALADYFAVLWADAREPEKLAAALSQELEDYRFCNADRREQRGDGSDAGARQEEKSKPESERGESEDADEPELEKNDSGSPGSGNNENRQGDESGSLSGEEVKPKGTAGNNGREDRGESQSDGRSNNHGATGRGDGMHNSEAAASELAQQEGPGSIAEVIGARFGAHTSPNLTHAEIDAMLQTAAADLDREAASEKRRRVDPGKKAPLTHSDLAALDTQYENVSFLEKFIVPENRRLPPEFQDEAKRLHNRLDRILREQRIRTANHRKGSLSQKDIWKIEVGDPDVFQRKTPPTKCDSDFYLLIDRSGSMGTGFGNGNSKLFTALLTAAVIEEALKGIANTKIVAFDGGPDIVEHLVIKDFNQKAIGNRCCDALDQIDAGNGNKDGYSIRAAAMDLEKRSEKRRILVVLSDGLPSAYRQETEAIADVRTAVQEARRHGIIVIPIMYGTPDPEESFEAYRKMYEKGIVATTPANILPEFEKILLRLIQ